MKLEVQNPLSGQNVNAASPKTWIKLVGGAALLIVVYNFGKSIAGIISSKLPGPLSGYGQKPTVNDPYAGLRVWQ